MDPSNGKLATRFCPVVFREAFLSGTEPRETCSDHGPTDLGEMLWRRFFDWFGRPKPPDAR